jgi:hypothetical protein
MPDCICHSSEPNIDRRIGTEKAVELQRDSPSVEKKMHKRSSSEEYLELAQMCLLEAGRTLDREEAEGLLTMAERYREEANELSPNLGDGRDQAAAA